MVTSNKRKFSIAEGTSEVKNKGSESIGRQNDLIHFPLPNQSIPVKFGPNDEH